MRAHVGGHILREEITGPNICGFCGRDVCSIELKASSKKGAIKFFKISRQDCPYFFDYGRKSACSKKNPCTNRVICYEIDGCISTVWTYNIQADYTEKHPDINNIPMHVESTELKKVIEL